MEQIQALEALEPFLALTKSASNSALAADLIIRAISHPSTYLFSNLLAAPQIRALAASPNEAHLTLLKIFSYGTYTDYLSTPTLPALSSFQTLKLRQLTLLTVARDPANLAYPSLLQSLALETQRQLEDLVISAIFAGLLDATLDPYHQIIRVSSVSPLRDVAPNSVATMVTVLDDWASRCTKTVSDLEAQVAAIRSTAVKRYEDENEWQAALNGLSEQSINKHGKDTMTESRGNEQFGRQDGISNALGRKLGHGVATKRSAGRLDEDDIESASGLHSRECGEHEGKG